MNLFSSLESQIKNSPLPSSEEKFQEGYGPQRALKEGSVIEGTVVSINKEGLWVDVSAKTEGIVPPLEMKSIRNVNGLKSGDKILVYILETENDEGRLLLSVDRARILKWWQELERGFSDGAILEVEVKSFNKGGLLADYESIRGFVPISHLTGIPRQGEKERAAFLKSKVGQKVKIKIMELDRPKNRLVFSEKSARQELQEKIKEKALSELKEGETRKGKVTSLHDFGAFVNIGGIDGLLPLSEISWEKGKKPNEVLQPDTEIEVYILKVDKESKKVLLSLRKLLPHPWLMAGEKYQVGQLVEGCVTKLMPFGAFVALEDYIEGLIHISELSEKRINHPKEVLQKGANVTVKILAIDPLKRRISLSLKQAQQEMV